MCFDVNVGAEELQLMCAATPVMNTGLGCEIALQFVAHIYPSNARTFRHHIPIVS